MRWWSHGGWLIRVGFRPASERKHHPLRWGHLVDPLRSSVHPSERPPGHSSWSCSNDATSNSKINEWEEKPQNTASLRRRQWERIESVNVSYKFLLRRACIGQSREQQHSFPILNHRVLYARRKMLRALVWKAVHAHVREQLRGNIGGSS